MQIRATRVYNLKKWHSRCVSRTSNNDVVRRRTTSFLFIIHYFGVHNATRSVEYVLWSGIKAAVGKTIWRAVSAENNNCFDNTLPVAAVEYIHMEISVDIMYNYTEKKL